MASETKSGLDHGHLRHGWMLTLTVTPVRTERGDRGRLLGIAIADACNSADGISGRNCLGIRY